MKVPPYIYEGSFAEKAAVDTSNVAGTLLDAG